MLENTSKSVGQPEKSKDGMVEFFLRVQPPVEDNPSIGLKEDAVGCFLINDVSRDLIQIDRQRKGIERLQELEADNNVTIGFLTSTKQPKIHEIFHRWNTNRSAP